jgi:hypothetical protein
VVQYRDLDPTQGATEGTLLVRTSVEGARTDGFEVRWATADGAKEGGVLTTLPRSEITQAFTLLAGSKVPAGAEHFSVRSFYASRDGARLSSAPVAVRADNFPRTRDVGADAGLDSFAPLGGFLDTARSRLLALGLDTSNSLAMRTCDLVGANCVGKQLAISPSLRTNAYTFPVFDAVQRRILFPAVDILPGGQYLRLVVCNDDGDKCTLNDLSAGTSITADTATAALDETQNKLFIASSLVPSPSAPAGSPIALFRCERAGIGCVRVTLPLSGVGPRMVFAGDTGPLYVGASDAVTGHMQLIRCQRDGSACSAPLDVIALAKLEAPAPGGLATPARWDFPAMAWDRTNQRLLVTGGNATFGSVPALVRCSADLGSCTAKVGLVPGTSATISTPRLLVSDVEQKAYIVSPSPRNSGHPIMIRCDLDGTNCLDRDLAFSTGQGESSGVAAVAALDPSVNVIYVFSRNASRGLRPWLFRCAADGSQGCTSQDVSWPAVKGQTVFAGNSLSLAVDAQGGMVLATTNLSDNARLALFGCDDEAKQCSFTDGSARQGANSAFAPQLLVASDVTRRVVTQDQQEGRLGLPTLISCTGAGVCTAKDLAGSSVPVGQLVVATEQDESTGELRGLMATAPYMLRCAKGASACTHNPLVPAADTMTVQTARFHAQGADVIAKVGDAFLVLRCDRSTNFACQTQVAPAPPMPALSTAYYTDVRQTKDGALLVAGVVVKSGSNASFFGRCPLLGTCSFFAFPTGSASDFTVRFAVDERRNVAYVARITQSTSVSGETTLHRCPLSVPGCTTLQTDASSFGAHPDLIIGTKFDRLYMATQNAHTYNRPQVLVLDLF